MTVTIIDSEGDVVATLVRGQPARRATNSSRCAGTAAAARRAAISSPAPPAGAPCSWRCPPVRSRSPVTTGSKSACTTSAARSARPAASRSWPRERDDRDARHEAALGGGAGARRAARGGRDRRPGAADAPSRRRPADARRARPAVPGADLQRRANGEPAGAAVPGGGRGRRRAPAPRRARRPAHARTWRAAGRAGELAFWGTPGGDDVAAGRRRAAVRAAERPTPATPPRAARTCSSSTSPSGCCSCSCSMVRWRRELLLRCLGIVVAEAVLFAGVGFVEYARKSLFLNPKVVAANEFDNYFRVNSVFFDPSIYGRFLALVMIAVSHGRAVDRQPARGGDRRVRARVAAGGPGDQLLAVEHRRAAARPGGARRLALRRARDAADGHRGAGARAGRRCSRRRRACTSG